MNNESDVRAFTEPGPGGSAGTAVPAAAAPAVRDLVRDEVVLSAGIWIVKVGTSVLTGSEGTLDPGPNPPPCRADQRRHGLGPQGCAGQLRCRRSGDRPARPKRRPDNLRQLQAAAAIGQAYLIRAYDEGLRQHGRHAAQLLLTHEDFDSRPRYLNMRNTLHALFEYNAVPIINENDTISVDEIKFGDNDRLAAMVTNLLQAPLLVILSVVDGLYATDPVTQSRTDLVAAGPPDRRLGAGPGRLEPQRPGHRRNAEQACRRPAGDPGWRIGHHRLGNAAQPLDPHPRR